jgi:hypothetical protein
VLGPIGIPMLRIWNATMPFWNFHRKSTDCTHFCDPGPHQVWVYLLNRVG